MLVGRIWGRQMKKQLLKVPFTVSRVSDNKAILIQNIVISRAQNHSPLVKAAKSKHKESFGGAKAK